MSYLIQATHRSDIDPIDSIAQQRIALLRIYFYSETLRCFSVTPEVKRQCELIADATARTEHQSWDVLIDELNVDGDIVRNRANQLVGKATALGRHASATDATILAECEHCGVAVLLTYDKKFNGFLRQEAKGVRVLRPIEYWEELNIPSQAAPVIEPAPSNPLRNQSWWRW